MKLRIKQTKAKYGNMINLILDIIIVILVIVIMILGFLLLGIYFSYKALELWCFETLNVKPSKEKFAKYRNKICNKTFNL